MENPEGIQISERDGVYFYRLPGEKTFHSTGVSSAGKRNRQQAYFYAESMLDGREKKVGRTTFGEYTGHFFVWGECSWINRRLAKGDRFTQAHAAARRAHLVKYILPRFKDTLLTDISAAEIDQWLLALHLADSTRNAVLYSLNIILKHAQREKLIETNPIVDAPPMKPLKPHP